MRLKIPALLVFALLFQPFIPNQRAFADSAVNNESELLLLEEMIAEMFLPGTPLEDCLKNAQNKDGTMDTKKCLDCKKACKDTITTGNSDAICHGLLCVLCGGVTVVKTEKTTGGVQ